MPRLVVGLLRVDKHNFGNNPNNRMDEFRMTVQQANSLLKTQMGGANGVRMLVAPEYYWSGYDEIGHNQTTWGALPIKQTKKHEIYAGLQAISAQAGSLVLVAGSVFYKKQGVARNVCPVLRYGQFLLKSYKQLDDGYAPMNPNRYVYATKPSDPYFEVDDIRFGLEVCADHGLSYSGGGKLRQWAEENNMSVDVQILISDGSTLIETSVVAEQYVLQCDIGGLGASIGAYEATGPFDTNLRIGPRTIGSAQVNGASVYCYTLEW